MHITLLSTTIGLLGVILSLPAWWFFLSGALRLTRFVRAGSPDAVSRTNRPLLRLSTLIFEVASHNELMRRPTTAVAHWLVMVGFLIGSLFWFEAYIQTFNPHGGWPWVSHWEIYHLADEILGLGTVIGILVLIVIRRLPKNRNRFFGSNNKAATFVEAVVLLEGIGMLLVKAGKYATFPDLHSSPYIDFFTYHLAHVLPASPAMVSIFALIKLLTGMVWLFIVGQQLRWGVAWHRFLAFFTIYFQKNPDGKNALGKLNTPGRLLGDPDNQDEEPTVPDFSKPSWKMLLDSATCTECGRCQDVCPAWNTGKPLSPKLLMNGIRDTAIEAHDAGKTPTISLFRNETNLSADALWSCTNCGACVEQCPVDIEHIDHVNALRRHSVLDDSEFPEELNDLFRALDAKGNPWGYPAKERLTWIEEARRDGLEVPTIDTTDPEKAVAQMADVEYLFWVGCAGTFDDAGRATTRAIVELLHVAGVKFGVLGKNETCTGDPARRAGNEFLFQMLAEQNVETLNTAFAGTPKGQRKIITSCAHCFNTLRNEYPDFDGHYDVFHHTQLLNRLVREKRLTPIPRPASAREPITYHDPCFLGRHNKVFDPPRELLATVGDLKEMPRNKDNGFCCGAGGARMFMEEKLGTRIANNRSEEALATNATTIAVGCPFCNTMLTGGIKATAHGDPEQTPRVRDIAQMLNEAIRINDELPAPRPKEFLDAPVRMGLPTTGLGIGIGPGADLGLTPKRKKPADSENSKTSGESETQAPKPAAAPTPSVPAAGAPKAPGVPAPGAVATPKPATPAAPAAPGAPKAPGTPAAPGAPAPGSASVPKPAAPAAPGVPKAPGTPAAPGTPKAPGAPKPAVPGAPGVPAPGSASVPKPAAPAAPGTPKAPGAPAAPGAPKAPGVAAPGAAAVPKPGTVPPAPGAPAAPGSATAPKPAVPKPEAPKAPAAPGISKPGAPKAPGVPKAPGLTAPVVPAAPGSAAVPKPATPKPGAPAAPGGPVPPAPGTAQPAPDSESEGKD
ncbi:MAG: (Fe-S)-binding protein [Corynebacterium sp.]|nr:(Fe-S)-binding protein [Corynebacterium sp.]